MDYNQGRIQVEILYDKIGRLQIVIMDDRILKKDDRFKYWMIGYSRKITGRNVDERIIKEDYR